MSKRKPKVTAKKQHKLELEDFKITAETNINFDNADLIKDDDSDKDCIEFKKLIEDKIINYSQKQYAKGVVNTNDIEEGCFALLKKDMKFNVIDN